MASLVENKRRTQETVVCAGTLVDPHAASCPGIGAPQRVTFIRHGQSEGNAARSRGIKRTDPRLLDCGLTRKGVGEATAAGADIRVEPDLVVVSPLTRALATCLHLRFAAAPIVCYPGIKEIGSKLPENARRPVSALRRDRDLCCLPRFEDIDFSLVAEGEDATLQGFAAWLQGRPERDIWVVAHHNSIQWLLKDAGGHIPNCVPIPTEMASDGTFRPVG